MEPRKNNKNNTPLLMHSNITKWLTPNTQMILRYSSEMCVSYYKLVFQSNITPFNGNIVKKLPNSISKVIGLPKPSTKISAHSKTPSMSRESSTEDQKSAKIQQITEEKKKKRELKQQAASKLKEAKEKERTEKLKKLMEGREEKARKKAIEAEQKHQLEEITRNLKLQEEKREAQKRLEKQKQREIAEAIGRERELLENEKILQAKEQIQQKIQQTQKLLMQKKMAENFDSSKPKYDFAMLNSDDSTDDEEKTNSERPPPPNWSRPTMRQLFIERQVPLPTKIVDSFFSVQPMTPNLAEIFPKIEARYLKRNSSFF